MTAASFPRQAAIAHAQFDGEDRLIAADAALADVNTRAGGRIGLASAIPQLATIVRLVRRLGIPVARRVVIADEETDVELWVQARPEGSGVRLAANGWTERAVWRPSASLDAGTAALASDADWRWEADAALRLTFVTIAAGLRHGFDALGMLGQPITALFAIGPEASGGVPLIDALAARRGFAAQPARLRPSEQPVELSAVIRRDASGAFAGFTGAVRMGRAPTLDTLTSSRLIDGLDKALRRPLARIVANADSIHARAEGAIGTDYAGYAADIAHAGRHLMGLVDDLVDLDAIDRSDFVPLAEPIDLADVARRAAGLLAVKAADADVTIVRPAPDVILPAVGDFRRTLQVLVNLITNAVRYAPSGSTVDVSVGPTATGAAAYVTDRGKGIAPDDQARIFDKFERVDPGEPGGSGLGLYIARRLARAMVGDLVVESAPELGARFTLTLPAAGQPARGEDQD